MALYAGAGRALGLAGIGVLLGMGMVASGAAQETAGQTGVLLVATGGGSAWNERVYQLAERVARVYPIEVALLHWEGPDDRSFQVGAARLAERGIGRIVVVPLLISSHSGHAELIRYLAGATDSLPERLRQGLEAMGQARANLEVEWLLSRALDDAPELADVLADRARALASSPADEAVFLVGHGPNSAEDAASWMKSLRAVADGVRQEAGFSDVKVGLLRDDAPPEVRAEAVRGIRETIELQYRLTGCSVIVVPVLISHGHLNEELRRDLAGLSIRYTGEPLLPHPAIERWVLRQAVSTGER